MNILNKKMHRRWLEKTTTLADMETLTFAERWAELVETEVRAGQSFTEVWLSCKLKVKDLMRISPIMESQAKLFLIQVWVFGEDLRKADEGGE